MGFVFFNDGSLMGAIRSVWQPRPSQVGVRDRLFPFLVASVVRLNELARRAALRVFLLSLHEPWVDVNARRLARIVKVTS